jgi:hypothetical protein
MYGGSMEGVSIIERALQIAPECATLQEVRKRLKSEGYSETSIHENLMGRGTRMQIHDRLDPARKKPIGGVLR